MGQFGVSIARYSSIDEVDPERWDELVEPGDVVNTHAYLRAVEHARLAGIQHRYLEFLRGSRIIAHASVCLFTFSLDVLMEGFAKRVIASLGAAVKRFLMTTVVECGHPTALGPSIVIRDGEESVSLFHVIDRELAVLAEEAGTSLIDIRDVYASERDGYDALAKLGYRTMPNMANTYFRVYQESYDEYLADLVSKRRYEVVRRSRLFDQQGGVIEKVVDFAPIADELEALWCNTFDHATEYQREVLNAAYFRHMSDYLGDRSFALVCRKEDTLIGFTMYLDAGDTLVSTYCGLDYRYNRSMYTYFVLFYRSIEEAILLGKTWLELGVTNYSPKIEVGAVPKPMYVYAKSTRPFVNAVLMPILTWVTRPRVFEKRRIFNSRFFERHSTNGSVEALIDGTEYRVRDVSAEGVGIEGTVPVTRKRVTIDVRDSEGVFVRLSGRLQNSTRVGDGTWRMGFRVKMASPEYLPLWNSLIQRRAIKAGEPHG